MSLDPADPVWPSLVKSHILLLWIAAAGMPIAHAAFATRPAGVWVSYGPSVGVITHLLVINLVSWILPGGSGMWAALAVTSGFRYMQSSARYIFGDTPADSTAARILRMLQDHPTSFTRTEFHKVFTGHLSRNSLQLAIDNLAASGQAFCEHLATAGRPTEQWFAVTTAAKHRWCCGSPTHPTSAAPGSERATRSTCVLP